ncbi:MAG: RrF2 family transcriptional regulator, partial [Pseudanabaena sp.]
MELSCKVDYACIALLELAMRHKQGKPTSVSEIAISQSIPIRYLDQVMSMLRRAGIIKSQRGA